MINKYVEFMRLLYMPKANNKIESSSKISKTTKVVENKSDSESDVEDVVINDNSDSDSDSEDNESEVNDNEESDNDEGSTIVKDKKEKPKKLSYSEIRTEVKTNNTGIQQLEKELDELEEKRKDYIKKINALNRTNNKLDKLLDKAHEDDIVRARKEKKKRNITEPSGILKPLPVPPILINFLDLKPDTVLCRTKVMSLLSNKFKDLGLKQGQKTILDKKTAKLFGVLEGHTIEFNQGQTFLKNIYETGTAKSTEVSL